ncbi:MAG: transposase [Clostridiales bacterium]|nr:transposase [Clostridiales bacterium]
MPLFASQPSIVNFCLLISLVPNPENKTGRPRQELEIMLRMYLVQTWFSLSDEAAEESVYDGFAIRNL